MIRGRPWGWLRRAQIEERLSDEMRFHLDMAIEQNIRAGMSPMEARRAALIAFGGRDRWMEAARDEVRSRQLDELVQDLRHAGRGLRRSPAFTAAAVATLALCIGATTAVFSVVNAVLLRPLPYPDADRLVVLCEHNTAQPDAPACNTLNPGNFLLWRDAGRSFDATGAFVDRRTSLNGAGLEPVSVATRLASAGTFTALGAHAVVGRLYGADDDRAGAPNVILLSDAFWRRQFGGDPGVVGRDLVVDGRDYTVIGVAGPGATFRDPVDLWIPIRFTAEYLTSPGRYLRAVARLRPGVSVDEASREMARLVTQRARELPAIDANWSALAMPIRPALVGDSPRALWILLGAVGFLLVIGCVNVANLLLARAADREVEVAVRMSLGAAPTRILRQLLTESVVLSLVSGSIGVLLALGGTRALVALVPSAMALPSLVHISVDWRVLVFTAAVVTIAGVAFGLTPAVQAARTDAQQMLRGAGRAGSTASRSGTRLRNALVVTEISLALVLLAGAGLMIRSFAALAHVRLGFDPAHVLTTRLTLSGERYRNDTTALAAFRAIEQRVASLPGVSAVGMISYLPLTGQRATNSFNVEGGPAAAPGAEPVGDMRAVTPGYFTAMGIALEEGRGLTEEDRATSPAVALVSETLARTFWPHESAVGHYLRYEWYSPERVRIVGVMADVHDEGPDKAALMEIYRPLSQFPYAAMTLVVRGAGDPASWVAQLRRAVQSVDRQLPLAEVHPMADLAARSLGRTRLSTTLFSLFGALGLVLASVGIYGVVSYTVQQRRHEIAIRLALGARSRDVTGMVLRRSARLVMGGIAIGTVGALLATRLMAALLFGVTPADAATFLATAGVLATVALLAAYVPARRTTAVNPVAALRGE